jgi:hypothetical protein
MRHERTSPPYYLLPRVELKAALKGEAYGVRYAFVPHAKLGDQESRTIRMSPVPRPGDDRCLVEMGSDASPDETVYFIGSGPTKGHTDYVCGSCGAILVKGVRPGTIQNIVLYCVRSKTYNDTPKWPKY